MSVYTVPGLNQVASIYPDGAQGEVSVYNRGPATVFLGSDASLAPGNGYEVPALAEVRWRANRPLFLVSASDMPTQVIINESAIGGDISRASVYTELYRESRNAAFGQGMYSIETAAFNTLILTYQIDGIPVVPSLTRSRANLTIGIEWYDRDRNVLGTDSFVMSVVDRVNPYRVTIPVRGYSCQIITFNPASADYTSGRYTTTEKVYGTTKTLPQSHRSEVLTYADGRLVDGYYVNNMMCAGIMSATTGSQEVLIPALGQYCTLTFRYHLKTPAGTELAQLYDDDLAGIYYSDVVKIPAGSFSYSIPKIAAPTNRPLKVFHTPLGNSQPLIFNAVFTD